MKQKRIPIIILITLVFLASIGGAYYFRTIKKSDQAISQSPHYVNFHSSTPGEYAAFFTGQIVAPKDYLVSDSDMFDEYNTTGGSAPPIIVLTKNFQVLNTTPQGNYHEQIIVGGKNDCIEMWSTNGFSSINDWNDHIKLSGTLSNEEIITVEKRTAKLYLLQQTKGSVYVGYLPIGNKDESSYYFVTCNTNNKDDVISVIKSIKFRPDYSFE